MTKKPEPSLALASDIANGLRNCDFSGASKAQRALVDEAIDALAKMTAERDKEKARQHREFWDVERERQAVCLAVKHHSNSGTPVSSVVREKMAELAAAETALTTALAEMDALREALKPFVAIADGYSDAEDDAHEIWTDASEQFTRITLGQCRALRTLATKEPSHEA